jgi:hypothetical protein
MSEQIKDDLAKSGQDQAVKLMPPMPEKMSHPRSPPVARISGISLHNYAAQRKEKYQTGNDRRDRPETRPANR